MAAPQAFKMNISGVDQLLATFRNYFNDIDTSFVILNAVSAIGVVIEARAKEILNEKIYNTPQVGGYIRTGLLRARTVADKANATKDQVTVIVRSKQKYAPYIEFGTSKMKPRAFLLPAAQDQSKEALDILNDALTDFLKGKIVK